MALTYDQILRAQRAFQQQGNRTLLDRLYDQYGQDEVIRVAEAGPPAPTFLQRLQAGFATDPLSEAQIYQAQGVPAAVQDDKVVYQTPQGMAPVDPEGFDIGDIADLGGEAPATILSILGGLGGALAGPWTAAAGAVAGGTSGDVLRQNLAQEFGSKRDYDFAQTGLEGATSVLGEAGGALASKALRGPLRKSMEAPGFKELGEDVQRFDVDFETNLAGTAPVEATASGDLLAGAAQRLREDDAFSAQMRDKVDIPFRQEISEAMDKIKYWLPGEGPTATRRSREEVGEMLRKAVESTQAQRRGTRTGLYEAFEEVIDPSAMPDLTNTNQAINEIMGSNLMRRQKSGTTGRPALEAALEEAGTIDSYKTLQVVRQGIFDEANMAKRDPTKLSQGVETMFDKLYQALKADENAFLEAGGGIGSDVARARGGEAMRYAAEMFGADENRFVRRLLGDADTASNIPDQLRNATPEQIKALRVAVGMGSPDVLKQGAQEGMLEATEEGVQAWAAIQLEVFKNLRQAAQTTPGQLRQRMVDVERGGPELISGQKLMTEMNKYKEGALEEIFGPAVTNDLKRFASIVKDLTLTESTLKGFSNTPRAQMSMWNDFKEVFFPGGNSAEAVGRIVSRGIAGFIGTKALTTGVGKRFLRGENRWQNLAPATALESLGRLGGQIGARQYFRDPIQGRE